MLIKSLFVETYISTYQITKHSCDSEKNASKSKEYLNILSPYEDIFTT